MKDILIQLVKVFLIAILCVVQLIALVFAGIAWVFEKIAELLGGGTVGVIKKLTHSKEEETSEEAPA